MKITSGPSLLVFFCLFLLSWSVIVALSWPRGYKIFVMLNSTEHKIPIPQRTEMLKKFFLA